MVGQVIRIVVLVAHILVLSLQLEAQNLVPNGGFETHSGCPQTFGELDRCLDWFGNDGTPDYYHKCGIANHSVPSNFPGYQENYFQEDSAYVGLVTYTTLFPGGQESVFVSLDSPLVSGTKYRVKFRVSSADSVNYTSCCVGVILDHTAPPEPPYTSNLADIEIVLNSAEIDNQLWYEVDQVYTAEGGENKLFIGNFRPDAESDPHFKGEIVPGSATAYFYVDDVEVYEDDLVGVEELEKPLIEVSVYPNPATDVLNFSLRQAQGRQIQPPVGRSLEVTVVDFSGREVETLRGDCFGSSNLAMTGSCSIDVSGWCSGIYLLSVRDENGNVVSKRVVKE